MSLPLPRLTLTRRWFDPERTVGELFYGSRRIAYTLEPGWLDTDARVDFGFYHCVRHDSERFGQTWALVGETVSHFPEPGVLRSTIIFHRGNLDEDTRGCILLGLSRGLLNEESAVLESRKAMKALRNTMDNREFYLTIARR